jgi:hypothetical protein
MYVSPQAAAPRTGPINRSVDVCYDCAAAPGQRHTNLCDLSPVKWADSPFAWAPWLGSVIEEGA